MISVNQKALTLLCGLMLAFNFPADASLLRQQGTEDGQAHDDPLANDDEEGQDDASPVMVNKKKEPTYEVQPPHGIAKKGEKKEEEEEEGEDASKHKHVSTGVKKEQMRIELASNLREQSELKHTIAHLTDESESDEEIEAAATLVANETESVALGDTLEHMWKEMRMFEVPAYTTHVEHELHHLKHDEKVLEAQLKGEPVKMEDKENEEKHKEEDKDMAAKNAKLAVEDKGQTSAVNFWKMNRQSQKQVLMSSLVYMIGGVLFAVLFKQMRSKHFEVAERLDAHANTKDFSFSIFGCLGDMKLCVLGFCCPCLAWANTLERNLKVPYWKAFLAFFGLLLLHAYTMGISSIFVIILGVFYRQKLRDSYGIDSYESGAKMTVAIDFLLWSFCQPCAIIQEAREETCKRDKPAGP